jgi:hypothetical protein
MQVQKPQNYLSDHRLKVYKHLSTQSHKMLVKYSPLHRHSIDSMVPAKGSDKPYANLPLVRRNTIEQKKRVSKLTKDSGQ